MSWAASMGTLGKRHIFTEAPIAEIDRRIRFLANGSTSLVIDPWYKRVAGFWARRLQSPTAGKDLPIIGIDESDPVREESGGSRRWLEP